MIHGENGGVIPTFRNLADCDDYRALSSDASVGCRLPTITEIVRGCTEFPGAVNDSVADPGGFVRFGRTPFQPDPGVVAENARTGCIRVDH